MSGRAVAGDAEDTGSIGHVGAEVVESGGFHAPDGRRQRKSFAPPTIRAFYRRHWPTESGRTLSVTRASIAIDLIVGIGLLTLGIQAGAIWQVASAVYYFTLAVTRYLLLAQLRARSTVEEERKGYRRTGWLMAGAGVVYLATNVLVYATGVNDTESIVNGYVIAALALVKGGLAIGGLIAAHRRGSPVRIALRTICVADWLVSMSVAHRGLMGVIGGVDPAGTAARVGIGFAAVIAMTGMAMAANLLPRFLSRQAN